MKIMAIIIITSTQKRYQSTNCINTIANVKTNSLPVSDILRDLLKKNLNCILLKIVL
jgi:hypothetical protein